MHCCEKFERLIYIFNRLSSENFNFLNWVENQSILLDLVKARKMNLNYKTFKKNKIEAITFFLTSTRMRLIAVNEIY